MYPYVGDFPKIKKLISGPNAHDGQTQKIYKPEDNNTLEPTDDPT